MNAHQHPLIILIRLVFFASVIFLPIAFIVGRKRKHTGMIEDSESGVTQKSMNPSIEIAADKVDTSVTTILPTSTMVVEETAVTSLTVEETEVPVLEEETAVTSLTVEETEVPVLEEETAVTSLTVEETEVPVLEEETAVTSLTVEETEVPVGESSTILVESE